ncbi:Hypothetical protein CAP_2943 [Chondromyces apiculatus DSM 436]|uniref:Lcl C-terminal domain-containing protein n=1 Tax=Chondromyces apiculatus DSM 436 TaxID=1192034 RepID=A0A017T8S4_9BACT|nr:Hypothetical protein CAP_2943 [Chondromyces apiculatus DSM 436]
MSLRGLLLVSMVTGCSASGSLRPTSSIPAPTSQAVQPPAAIASAERIAPAQRIASAQLAVAGTVLFADRHVEPCWTTTRVLVHAEAMLRPTTRDDDEDPSGGLLWFDARSPRPGADPACEVRAPYAGDLALLQPGTRVAVFGLHAKTGDDGILLRPTSLTLSYAAPFDALPLLAEQLGPAQTARRWLAPARPALERRGDVVTDAATGLLWQHGASPRPLAEGAAHEYCEALALGGRDDWRVPSPAEVETLFDRTGHGVDLLPSDANDWYWTGGDGQESEPYVVSYGDGTLADTHYDDPGPFGPYLVRCVAGHLAAARRILVSKAFSETATEMVDPDAGLAWSKQPRTATSHAEAKRSCAAPWRLATGAELRSRERLLDPDRDDEMPVWSADSEHLDDPAMASVRELATVGAVVCVQPRPRPRLTGTRSYPSGEVFADGAKRYWEPGQLAWDGTRSLYPDGRPASEVRRVDGVPEGPATFHARDGKVLATLTFHRGRLDGAITITAEEMRVTATATAGVLRGPAEIQRGESTVRGAYADGTWDGVWTHLRGKDVVAKATFRKGMLHGAATVGGESGRYADGLRDGTWRGTDGATRSEGTFARGTGVWRQWTGAQLSREEPYQRDLRHGEMKVWSASGALTLRLVYDRGREVEHDYRDASAHWARTPTRETHFHANGTKREETERRDGVAHGTYTRWNEQGHVVESGAYQQGKRTGTWRQRAEGAGKTRTQVTVWREGRLVEVPRWEE